MCFYFIRVSDFFRCICTAVLCFFPILSKPVSQDVVTTNQHQVLTKTLENKAGTNPALDRRAVGIVTFFVKNLEKQTGRLEPVQETWGVGVFLAAKTRVTCRCVFAHKKHIGPGVDSLIETPRDHGTPRICHYVLQYSHPPECWQFLLKGLQGYPYLSLIVSH